MSDLKAYHELACENLDVISAKVLDFIGQELASGQTGWIFLNTKNLLLAVPELMTFFQQHKLRPMDASITVLYDDFSIHVDTLPVIAKINFPIKNNQGWVNRWYLLDNHILDACETIVDHLGFHKKDVSTVTDKMTLMAELRDQSRPIVFNSGIPHSVIKQDAVDLPRVVLSVTFFNEPLDQLR